MAKQHGALSLALVIVGAGALTACNPSGGSAPGGVSEGEAAALEEAAEMLDERQLPEGTLPPIDGSQPAVSESTEPEQDAQEDTE